jgi:hypothetical protein
MVSVSPMRHNQFIFLLLGVGWFTGVCEGKVATEFITPDFSASYFHFIDTFGVFLRSRKGAFQAVVYNPAGQQERYYLAVVHALSTTRVWVANRAAPITDRAAPLRLTRQGISIEAPVGTVVWSTPPFGVPVAALRLARRGSARPEAARARPCSPRRRTAGARRPMGPPRWRPSGPPATHRQPVVVGLGASTRRRTPASATASRTGEERVVVPDALLRQLLLPRLLLRGLLVVLLPGAAPVRVLDQRQVINR